MLTPMMKMLMVVMMRRARITSDGRIVRVAWKAAMLTSFPATMLGMVKFLVTPAPRLARISAV